MRFLLASAIFAVIARTLRVEIPRGRAFIGAVLFGILLVLAAISDEAYVLPESASTWGCRRIS
jgi:hypothetical protein